MSKTLWAIGCAPDPNGRRCSYCRKRRLRARYAPYCSYHCEQMEQMMINLAYVATLRMTR